MFESDVFYKRVKRNGKWGLFTRHDVMDAQVNHLIETIELPEDHYLDQDQEILEVFIEELEEVFNALDTLLQQWQMHPDDMPLIHEVCRHFNNLKGTGRMVGANASSEIAWIVEETLTRVMNALLPFSQLLLDFVYCIFKLYQDDLINDFKQLKPHQIDLRPYALIGQQLQFEQQILPALLSYVYPNTITITAQPDISLVSDHPSRVELSESLNIFLDEISVYVQDITFFLNQSHPDDEDHNRVLRALHTIRGSSSMAEIMPLFEVSSTVESMIKQVLLHHAKLTVLELKLLRDYQQFIAQAIELIRQDPSLQKLQQQVHQFELSCQHYQAQIVQIAEKEQQQAVGIVAHLLELGIDELLDAEFEFEVRISHEASEYIARLNEQAALLHSHTDTQRTRFLHNFSGSLQHIYQDLLSTACTDFPASLRHAFQRAHEAMISLFDALAAVQHMTVFASYQTILDVLVNEVFQYKQAQCINAERDVLQNSDNAYNIAEPVTSQLSSYLALDRQQDSVIALSIDPILLEIFLEESEELLASIDAEFSIWTNQPDHTDPLQHLIRFLHTLKGGANMVQLTHIGLIAHELETIYQRLIYQQLHVSESLIKIMRMVQDELAERIQQLNHQSDEYPSSHVLDVLQHIEDWIDPSVISTVSSESMPDEQPSMDFDADQDMGLKQILELKPLLSDEVDTPQSLVENMFLEEAAELLQLAEISLQQWIKQRDQRHILLELQRIFHRLTRSARLLELKFVVDMATCLEITFERISLHNFKTSAHDAVLQHAIQWLNAAIFDGEYADYHILKQKLEQLEFIEPLFPVPIEQLLTLTTPQPAFSVSGDGVEPPSMHGEWENVLPVDETNDMIRVSSDLIEKMIDLSGENTINRSRIHMDMGHFDSILGDMELAIQRLSGQLKQLDKELESQSLQTVDVFKVHRFAREQTSNLQQLSKSLTESASDLLDFKSSLTEKIRDTESLLLQQSRIQAELQENLIRTRLVPFAQLLPRLQRTVRQAATTLNRPTQLLVHNTEGELDRSILERLVMPLEHMLRNAVDHGIEDPLTRIKQGKPSIGTIELSIRRHGTDVLLTLKDDGRGIDLEHVRQKAQLLGYLQPNQISDEQELLQYIFYPGFSTASQLTQLSGRGVGLDIVQNEIKTLGGKITVSSIYGTGTSFTIRVPTTVAVSDALMVKVNDQQFALPLGKIERIVRLSPLILEQYFNSQTDRFEFENRAYKLRYLGEFVDDILVPDWSKASSEWPVLLINAHTGQQVALLVDQVVGSRGQIVVKPIGQQFTHIKMVAGATILGDGQVCLILDPLNIAQQVYSKPRHVHDLIEELGTREDRSLIMVVDDSVTVRKVTSRLLERQGYDVVTAKDGQDALEQLEHIRPSLILLDIEMPQMDGFELTRYIRQHSILNSLPIIMITSRTGEKYREIAQQLGVDDYMGKPFQEDDLLTKIQNLLAQNKAIKHSQNQ